MILPASLVNVFPHVQPEAVNGIGYLFRSHSAIPFHQDINYRFFYFHDSYKDTINISKYRVFSRKYFMPEVLLFGLKIVLLYSKIPYKMKTVLPNQRHNGFFQPHYDDLHETHY